MSINQIKINNIERKNSQCDLKKWCICLPLCVIVSVCAACGSTVPTSSKSTPQLNSTGPAAASQNQTNATQKAPTIDAAKTAATNSDKPPLSPAVKPLPTATQTKEPLQVFSELRISPFIHCMTLNTNKEEIRLKAGCTETILQPAVGTLFPTALKHEKSSDNTLLFPVSLKPFCNVVSLSVESISPEILAGPETFFGYGQIFAQSSEIKSYSTKVATHWTTKQLSEFKFELSLNDDDTKDFKIILDSKGLFLFTVENSGLGCKPSN